MVGTTTRAGATKAAAAPSASPDSPVSGSPSSKQAKYTRKIRVDKIEHTKKKSQFSQHHKVYVVGVTGGIVLAWVQHKVYEEEQPAYTAVIERRLQQSIEAMQRLHISLISVRRDPEDPALPRQFRRRQRDGRLNPDPNATITQPIFVNLLDDPAVNTVDYRKTWGENLAAGFTALNNDKGSFQFERDVTPVSTPMGHLGDWIPRIECLDIARIVYDNISEEDILEADAILNEIYGDGKAQTIRDWFVHYREASNATVDPAAVLDRMDLSPL